MNEQTLAASLPNHRGGLLSIPLAFLLVLMAAACGEETVSASKAEGAPDIGDAAPPFTLKGSDGRTHSLSDHLGKRPVVLAWFPKAFTGG